MSKIQELEDFNTLINILVKLKDSNLDYFAKLELKRMILDIFKTEKKEESDPLQNLFEMMDSQPNLEDLDNIG